MLKVFIGSDHGGFFLKSALINWIKQTAIEFYDAGTNNDYKSCDYPIFARKVCENVTKNELHKGILICKTGIGMCITANKFHNVRAALIHDEKTAELARMHNDINILCLSGSTNRRLAINIAKKFLSTEFSNATRHINRLNILKSYETPHCA